MLILDNLTTWRKVTRESTHTTWAITQSASMQLRAEAHTRTHTHTRPWNIYIIPGRRRFQACTMYICISLCCPFPRLFFQTCLLSHLRLAPFLDNLLFSCLLISARGCYSLLVHFELPLLCFFPYLKLFPLASGLQLVYLHMYLDPVATSRLSWWEEWLPE